MAHYIESFQEQFVCLSFDSPVDQIIISKIASADVHQNPSKMSLVRTIGTFEGPITRLTSSDKSVLYISLECSLSVSARQPRLYAALGL
jgi:hypothetical protein